MKIAMIIEPLFQDLVGVEYHTIFKAQPSKRAVVILI